MKNLLHFFLLFTLCLIVGCDTPTANSVSSPKLDPNDPAVSSAPLPMTSSNLPTAPTPYNSPAMNAKGAEAAAPTTYGSTAMNAQMVAAPLVGSWTNMSDPEENIVFTDHSYVSYYEGQMIVEEEMIYHAVCPTSCSGGTSVGVPCFTITSDFGTDCYGIIRVNQTQLELSIIGQSTETVTYVRNNP
jgi:hypothetical protein